MRLYLSRRPSALFILLAAAILVTCAATNKASAQGIFARRLQTLYEGKSVEQSQIRVGSWGSGICETSTQNTYTGAESLKITPKDLYAGGRIDFTSPFDLTQSVKTPDVYLQLICQFWGTQTADSLTQALGTAAAATDAYGGGAPTPKQVRAVRVMAFYENGPAVECQAPLSAYKVGDDGWMIVSFPMSALKGKTDLPQYRLTRLAITGDGSEPFFIGEISTIADSKPLVAESNDDMEVSKNYSIAFQGASQSGASAVSYSWDFDKNNGIQTEAVGDLIYHRFTQSGNFQVTLTVTDIFGVKEPATKTINVKVNE
jgi:hypothetical protein